MAAADSASSPQASWKLVAAADGLGDPDAASEGGAPITAQASLPPPPPSAADSSIGGDVVTILGLIASVVLAILVRNSVLKAQVAKMKPYDAAKNTALIAAVLTFFVVAAIAVGVGQTMLKG